MQGKFIVIDGLDGCGKSTQFELLKGVFPDFRFITFPDYDSPSGQIITNYLSGVYGGKDDVNSYSASILYATDRYTSYKADWEKDYKSGRNIISARYTTSNAIYQMTKLEKAEWDGYCEWLYDLEYSKMGMPRPDAVIFLDVPVKVSQKLLSERYNGNEQKKDIHEADISFLEACHNSAIYTAEHDTLTKWHILNCSDGENIRSIDEIHEDIIRIINGIIKTGRI